MGKAQLSSGRKMKGKDYGFSKMLNTNKGGF